MYSVLIIRIGEQIKCRNLNKKQKAKLLKIIQTIVSALLLGKIYDYRVISLVNIWLTGRNTIDVAARAKPPQVQ